MRKQSDEDVRNSIIGLGEKSVRKSYYPQLKKKIKEVEELNRTLEEKVQQRTHELSEQKLLFETLFNQTADGVALIKDGHFIDCNNSILQMLGLKKKEDFLNSKPHQISPKYQPDGLTSKNKENMLIEQCMQKGHLRFEWVHQKANGEDFWVDILLTKIQLNKKIMIYVVWRDITDKKQLEEEIKKRNEELVKSLKNLKITQSQLIESEKLASLGSTVAGIAHEINTPVGIGLTGITHLLEKHNKVKKLYEEEDLSQEEFEDFLSDFHETSTLILANLTRTANLIKNFKQISYDQVSEEKRKFNLKEYLEQTLFTLHNLLKKRNITVELLCDDKIDIDTYPGAISQIITNLVINTTKHGLSENNGGVITIEAKKIDNKILLKYKDNGKGIKKEHLPKIFEPFFTTNRAKGGTGLGLNIIHNIVNNILQGSIRCKSKEHFGVEFIIEFKDGLKPLEDNKDVLTWQI